jgi:hypothetical protein
MSEFNQGAGLAIPGNTKTQIQDIAGQLYHGARWFDIRPVIAGGHWETGHYGYSVSAWRGGNGQSMDSVIAQINAFTAGDSISELIILYLSHGYDTDIFGGDEHNHLTQANWDDLLQRLLQINYLVKGMLSSQDLTQLSLSSFIENGPAVIIVVDDIIETANTKVDISSFIAEGIFSPDEFPAINSYANSDNSDDVMADQFKKLQDNRVSSESEMFVLSWTLTIENPIDAAEPAGIIGNAEPFNKDLFKNLWNNVDSYTYPNMLIVDAYPENGDIVALAIAINYWFAPACPTPGSGSSKPPAPPSSTSTPSKASNTPAPPSSISYLPPASSTSPASSSTPNIASPSTTIPTPSSSPTPSIPPPSDGGSSNSSYQPITPGICGTNLLVCEVQDPTRLEAPWAGVSAPFPQCYDPALYVCSDNFLCPVDAPKIEGEYACGASEMSQRTAKAIMCGLGYC